MYHVCVCVVFIQIAHTQKKNDLVERTAKQHIPNAEAAAEENQHVRFS